MVARRQIHSRHGCAGRGKEFSRDHFVCGRRRRMRADHEGLLSALVTRRLRSLLQSEEPKGCRRDLEDCNWRGVRKEGHGEPASSSDRRFLRYFSSRRDRLDTVSSWQARVVVSRSSSLIYTYSAATLAAKSASPPIFYFLFSSFSTYLLIRFGSRRSSGTAWRK